MTSDLVENSGTELALFEGQYPSQLRTGPAQSYQGEYRGFYPGSDGWKPRWSWYRGRPGERHGGLDIYAPFALQPLETPVRALADGAVSFRPGALEPDELGNRADLSAGGVILSYGHLSRFEGRSRAGVKKGDIIGYAGCSGNADTQGECRRCGDCNVNSGHVHLSVRQNGAAVRPSDHYPINLRFAQGQDLTGPMDCKDFVEVHGLQEAWEPEPPVVGALVGSQDMNRRRALDGPFALLEFDASARIEDSAKFYRQCADRLAKHGDLKDPVSAGDRLLAEFLGEKVNGAILAIADHDSTIVNRSGGKSALQSLEEAIVKDGAVIGLGDADKVPGWLIRHISRLTQMAYLVFGGAALDALGDNGHDGRKCELFDERVYGNAYLAWKSRNLPECGVGIGGLAYLSATRTARNAVHRTTINIAPQGSGPDMEQVLSVSFGAGSLMHATISNHMKRAPLGGTSFPADIEATIASYLDAAVGATGHLIAVHDICQRHQVLLSNEAAGPQAAEKRAEVLRLVSAAIKTAATGFAACPDLVRESVGAAALVRRMAEVNAALFERLVVLLREVRPKDPTGPGFFLLRQAIA